MSTETAAIYRDASPLGDAVRIAQALAASPHIASVAATEPGDDTVQFTDAGGVDHTLTLKDTEPLDDTTPCVSTQEAVAAAILNHRDFVAATPEDSRNLDTISIETRNGYYYEATLTVELRTDPRQEPAPASEVAAAAHQVLAGTPSPSERATAELLNYLAATWDSQDIPLREHAQALARSLNR